MGIGGGGGGGRGGGGLAVEVCGFGVSRRGEVGWVTWVGAWLDLGASDGWWSV